MAIQRAHVEHRARRAAQRGVARRSGAHEEEDRRGPRGAEGRVTDGSAVERAAKVYEAQAVAPHCTSCRTPCCRLQTVVLELDWPRVERLYQIGKSRRA